MAIPLQAYIEAISNPIILRHDLLPGEDLEDVKPEMDEEEMNTQDPQSCFLELAKLSSSC